MKTLFLLLIMMTGLVVNAQTEYNLSEHWRSTEQVPQKFDVYETNQYGFDEKVGEVRSNFNAGYDLYQNNQYGIPQRTQTVQPRNGGYDVYRYNQIGLPIKTQSVRPNILWEESSLIQY